MAGQVSVDVRMAGAIGIDPIPGYGPQVVAGDADAVRAAQSRPGGVLIIVRTTRQYFDD